MPTAEKSVPVEEQLKNARAMILMAEKQSIVRETLRAYAAEFFLDAERAGITAVTNKPAAKSPTSTGKAVASALSLLHGKFSYIEVIERIDEQGLPLNAKNRRTAVGSVLRRMCKGKIIREVEKGVGGKPSRYERLQTPDDRTPSARNLTVKS